MKNRHQIAAPTGRDSKNSPRGAAEGGSTQREKVGRGRQARRGQGREKREGAQKEISG